MRGLIDTAFKNYAALSPAEQLKIKSAWTGLGGILLFLVYEAYVYGWRKALGVFLAIALFVTVVALAAWLGSKLGKIFGPQAGTTIAAALILGFIGLVIFLIMSNWG